ncbi:MAG: ATP-binding protein [Acidobacteriia bacterium]|nr:ATP-binding protein [Terriglobia bacterium]
MTTEAKVCPICNGTGWAPVVSDGSQAAGEAGSPGVRRCDCMLDTRVQRLLKSARIPRRYEHCSFESYTFTSRTYPGTDSQKFAKEFARKFSEEYPLVDVGLLFIGPCGVGKTHLAVSILRSLLINKHIECRFYDFRELLKEIQNSYNPISQSSEMAILEPVLSVDVLLLDDLGAIKPSLWVQDTVAYILNARYNDKRTTLLTTNFLDTEPRGPAPEDDMRRGKKDRAAQNYPVEESLTDRIGVRMRSRLFEMCKAIDMTGEDFRQVVKQAHHRF